jgi:cobalt-zinc-cadmium efflux system membrane fusion protein
MNFSTQIGTATSNLARHPKATSRRGIQRVAIVVILFAAILGGVGWVLAKPRQAQKVAPTSDIPHVEGRRIVFSERFAKRFGLRTGDVRRAKMTPTVSVVGTVTFDPEHVSRIGTRLRGLVRDVRHYEGDTVKRGTLLAEIDSPELGEAQASVTTLRAQAEAARRNSIREKDLADQRLTTLKESEEADANKNMYTAMLAAARQKVAALAGKYSETNARALGVHELYAPLDGTIVERNVSKGQLVEGNHTAFVVADLDHLWVELAVFERNLPNIRERDEVELRPLGNTGMPLRGHVAHVGHVLDPDTRSAKVRVTVDNKNRLLRPGQAVDAIIHIASASVNEGLLVPQSAISFVDGNPTVFVAENASSVVAVEVTLGASDGREQLVESGLDAGQKVVVDGTFELKSELFR